MNALSSSVGLKVDFDMALLVIASGLYRLFARCMRGYADAQARPSSSAPSMPRSISCRPLRIVSRANPEPSPQGKCLSRRGLSRRSDLWISRFAYCLIWRGFPKEGRWESNANSRPFLWDRARRLPWAVDLDVPVVQAA